jgi:hypothetical protein
LTYFALFLVVDFFFRDKLFKLAVDHETIIRSKYATPKLDKVAKIVSELGDKYAVGIIIYISYHMMDHNKAFIVIIAAIVCQSFSCLLKGLYHEARPFLLADFSPS